MPQYGATLCQFASATAVVATSRSVSEMLDVIIRSEVAVPSSATTMANGGVSSTSPMHNTVSGSYGPVAASHLRPPVAGSESTLPSGVTPTTRAMGCPHCAATQEASFLSESSRRSRLPGTQESICQT